MLDASKLIEWSDEAARHEDFVLAQLLLHLATLKNLPDHRSIEIVRNFARFKAAEGVAANRVEVWEEVIDG